ncbi:MAG TPA: LLM class flavin-dependent oxidoreductase [Candidatus Limnocylindria bacterium]|nr:LLM class flavin-dependent oxidoreductase [Candidatus Limnocylindria bacterium]
MRIGIGLPTRVAGASPELLLEWAARADRGPFSSLAVTDRVVFDAQEPFVALAAAAGVTRRIRLVTSVVIAPTRETTLLARQAASLDALSGGRFTLGVGIGVREDDYAATGQRFHRRGRRLDEQLPLLRRIWSGAPFADGAGVIGPSPARTGGPELLIGGYVPAVARRIAAWGDGFMAPGGGDPAAMRALWRDIEGAWEAAGRAGRPRWVGASYYALGANADNAATSYIQASYGFDPAVAERRRRTLPTTEAAVRELISRQADMGVDELILRPCSADVEHLERLEAIAAAAS